MKSKLACKGWRVSKPHIVLRNKGNSVVYYRISSWAVRNAAAQFFLRKRSLRYDNKRL